MHWLDKNSPKEYERVSVMSCYLGDFKNDSKVYFCWTMYGSNGASVARSSGAEGGIIIVYRANMMGKLTAGDNNDGLTEYTSFDSLTGVNSGIIDLSAHPFYEAGRDYYIVLKGAVVEGIEVNALLGMFSIENRQAGSELFQTAAKMLVNKAVQDKNTGAIDYFDDDGQSVLLTHTPIDNESTIVRTPS